MSPTSLLWKRVLAGCAVAALGSAWADDAGHLIEQGQHAVQEGFYDLAISSFNAALDTHPSEAVSARIYVERSKAYEGQHEWRSAVKDLDQAIDISPRLAVAWSIRGKVYLEQSILDLAVTDQNEALRLNPKLTEAYLCRGEAYLAKAEWDRAVADFNAALRLDPNSPGAHGRRAQAYCDRGDYASALQDCAVAIKEKPNDSKAYLTLGRGLEGLGKWASAAQAFRKAADLDPAAPAPLQQLAWLLATTPDDQVRDGAKALEAGRAACELTQWKNEDCLNAVAAAFAETGDFDQAHKYQQQALDQTKATGLARGVMQASLAKYLRHEPFRMEPVYTLSDWLHRAAQAQRKGDYAAATSAYLIALRMKLERGQEKIIRYNLGNISLARHEWDKAVSYFNEALELDPHDAELLESRGVAYSGKGSWYDALTDYSASLAQRPSAQTFDNRAEVYFLTGKWEKALADCRDALRLRPDDAEALTRLAELLSTCPIASLRDGKKALEYAQKACQLTHYHDAQCLNSLATSCAETGDFDRALNVTQQAIALYEPDSPEAQACERRSRFYAHHSPYRIESSYSARTLAQQGMNASRRGDMNLAVNYYQAALRMEPDRELQSQIHSNLGYAFGVMGDMERSASESTNALMLQPNSDAYVTRARASYEKGDVDQSITDNTEAIRLNPRDFRAYANRGVAYARNGRYPEALRDFAQAIRLAPQDADSYNGRGYTYAQMTEWKNAFRDYDTALRLEPNHTGALRNRAIGHYKLHEWASAIHDLTQAAKLDGSNKTTLKLLTYLLASCPSSAQRDGKKAVQYGLKLCELDNNKDPVNLDILAQAYAEAGDYDQARKYVKQCMASPDLPEPIYRMLENHLDLFEQHKAVRIETTD